MATNFFWEEPSWKSLPQHLDMMNCSNDKLYFKFMDYN